MQTCFAAWQSHRLTGGNHWVHFGLSSLRAQTRLRRGRVAQWRTKFLTVRVALHIVRGDAASVPGPHLSADDTDRQTSSRSKGQCHPLAAASSVPTPPHGKPLRNPHVMRLPDMLKCLERKHQQVFRWSESSRPPPLYNSASQDCLAGVVASHLSIRQTLACGTARGTSKRSNVASAGIECTQFIGYNSPRPLDICRFINFLRSTRRIGSHPAAFLRAGSRASDLYSPTQSGNSTYRPVLGIKDIYKTLRGTSRSAATPPYRTDSLVLTPPAIDRTTRSDYTPADDLRQLPARSLIAVVGPCRGVITYDDGHLRLVPLHEKPPRVLMGPPPLSEALSPQEGFTPK